MKANRSELLAWTLILGTVLLTGCSDRNIDQLNPASGNTDPLVFDDAYAADSYFQPFFETHYTGTSIDSVFAYGGYQFDGARSLKFEVPPAGSALGLYLGGVITSSGARDLSGYNALTFYARAEQPTTLDAAGFGNDNTGTSLYEAGRSSQGALQLTTEWQFFIVPIPNPDRLISERGLLTIAESVTEHPEGNHIWLDEIRYANVGNIEVWRPAMNSGGVTYFAGSTVDVTGAYTIFRVDGAPVIVYHSPHYFDYTSSDENVAVIEGSNIRVVGQGTAQVTAKLGDVDVAGRVDVSGYLPPTTGAAAPALPAGSVISLFSDKYNDVLVDTWRANWGDGMSTQVQDFAVAGNAVKMYTTLNWVGILFESRNIDASEMTHFHLDLFAPGGTNFSVKFISFASGEGAESSSFTVDENSDPAYAAGQWVSIDIPLAAFEFAAEIEQPLTALGQLVLSSSNAGLVLVDNVYFHD